MRKRLLSIALILIPSLAVYVASYFVSMQPLEFLPGKHQSGLQRRPRYSWDPVAAYVFYPAFWIDHKIRPDYWNGYWQ